MAILTLADLTIDSRRVLLRVDVNVPLADDGTISDDSRILAALPTIRACLERDARLVVAAHLGRPKGKRVPSLSLEPVGYRLAELLDCEVRLTDEPAGDGVGKVVADLRPGHMALLENLRFDPGETSNDDKFAAKLAAVADVYVGDAFGAAHRAHASTVGVPALMTERGAGLLMYREIEKLSVLLGEVDRPYLAILGGAKVSGKIDVLEALLDRVDVIVIGGAMANTFLAAEGIDVGQSKIEPDKLPIARNFRRLAVEAGVAVHIPTDVVVGESLDDPTGRTVATTAIPRGEMALDIGPATVAKFAELIKEARTIFWNGPMGVFEREPFAAGTLAVARAVADNRFAYSVVGGGDSAAAAVQSGVADKISHVSTGGGASLEFVQGLTLPGIAALETD